MSAASAVLFVHVAVGPGDGLEASVWNRVAADYGLAVGPVLEPFLSALDLLERPPQVIAESAVGARLLEIIGLVTQVLGLARCVGILVLLELALDPSPLLGETCACAFVVHTRILLTAPAEERAHRACGFRT